MDSSQYKMQRRILLTIEFALIAISLVNGLRCFILSIVEHTVGTGQTPFLFNVLAAAALLYYAIKGYKNRVTSFRLACTFYLMSAAVALSRYIGYTNVAAMSVSQTVTVLTMLAATACMVVFSIAFKHQQETAITVGVLAGLLEFAVAVISVSTANASVADVTQSQPFGRVLIVAGLCSCLSARFHWRANEKAKLAQAEDDE